MAPNFKALIFDLGGVLLEWDRHSANALSPGQFLTIMNSTTWHDLDRGKLTVKAACENFGKILGVDPSTAEIALEQAQKSLSVNLALVQTIYDLKVSSPDLEFYVMSNISREHFKIVQALDLPWSMFSKTFISGLEGMRKPDLCFFEHVIREIGYDPSQMIFVDDTVENICAARSLGIYGILVDNKLAKVGGTLRNLLQNPLVRAEDFMKSNAKNHHCVVEGHNDILLKDNFAQLIIWELTGDADMVYLRWPSNTLNGNRMSLNGKLNGKAGSETFVNEDVKNNLWNYFCEEPALTTREFPPDADTTSIAYLSLPEEYMSRVANIEHVLDIMAANTDSDGIMLTYFTKERPRLTPEVCCNILRVFYRFGHGSDARIKKTEDWVISCLKNGACLDGNRHYSTPESFLYFVARLYAECGSVPLRKKLEVIKEKLGESLNIPTNPLALALRISACQFAGIDPHLYQKDLARLLSVQQEDGGWPAGHFCCYGRTGARIGNRGLTTALAIKILQHDQLGGKLA
ncbi:HAD-like protein [Biscogniauxia marginata]|nr:HAD-like protein [Biscogniauxia marginata]